MSLESAIAKLAEAIEKYTDRVACVQVTAPQRETLTVTPALVVDDLPGEPITTAELKPKRRRRSKAQIEADNAAEELLTEQVPFIAESLSTRPEAITKDDVTQAIQEILRNKTEDVALAVLQKFGVDRISMLKEDQYPACLAAAEAVMNG